MSGNLISWSALAFGIHFLAQLGVITRVLLRRHREPAFRVAWIAVVLFAPVLGIVAYLLFGEVNIGRRRILRMRGVLAALQLPAEAASTDSPALKAAVSERHEHLIKLGRSVSGFAATGGNRASLARDSNNGIDAIVADIDAARQHVHVLFYIWLPDNNGCKVVEALKRAAARGVICRAMADDLGSRLLIRSAHWGSMAQAGVRLARALPVGNPMLRPLRGCIDLRIHRKGEVRALGRRFDAF